MGSQTASNPLPHTLGWHILFLSNWLFVLTGQWHDLTAHLWTISVEEQFYLVWPFLILLAPYSFLRPLMVTVMLSAIAFRFWYVDIGDPEVGIWAITPASFDALALGGLIGIWRHEGGSMPTGWIVVVLLVAIPIVTYLTARQSNEAYYVFSETLWLVPLGLAVVGAHIGYGGFVGRMLELRPLLALGRISYGVYLWHVLCAAIVFEAVARTTGVRVELGILYFLIASSASVAVAALSYRFIEMPAMKHKVRFPYRGPAQG